MSSTISNLRWISSLEDLVASYDLSTDDFCIVGSATLAVRGLRENDDIDICFHPDVVSSIDTSPFEGIQSAPHKYEHIGISDEELIDNDKYIEKIDGYRIIRPEIEYSHKKFRNWDKDQRDVELLDQYKKRANWDQSAVVTDYTPRTTHLVRRAVASIRREGLTTTMSHGISYLQWHGPLGRSSGYNRQPTTICEKAIHSFRKDGPKTTIKRGVRLVKLKEPTGLLDRYSRLRHKAKLATLAERKLNLRYPTAALLTEQYEGDIFMRMDIVVRLLAAEAILQGEEVPTLAESFESITGTPFVEELKSKFNDTGNGDSRPTVPISYDSAIFDGNALAASLARSPLSPEVRVQSGVVESTWSREWFESQKFSEAEIETLEDRFSQLLYETNTLFPVIIWPPAQPQAEEIVDHISKEKSVHFTTQITFTDAEFEEFVWELYESQEDLNLDHIEAKIAAMSEYDKKVTVGGIEVPDPRIREGFSNEMIQMKERVRERFTPEILTDNPSANLLIHATDNYEHNTETWNIIEEYGLENILS